MFEAKKGNAMRVVGLLVGLLLLPWCGGCGDPFGGVERRIETRLPEVVGPADDYHVRVSRSVSSALGGKVRWVEVRGRNVQTRPGLTLNQVDIRLEGIWYDRKRRQLKEVRSAAIQVGMSAAAVGAYLHRRSPRLEGVQVSFLPDRIRLKVPGELVQAEGPVEVEGRPVMASPTTVDWKETRVVAAGYQVPADLLRKLEQSVNPIADLSHLKFPVQLTRLDVEQGMLTLGGAASLTAEQLQGLSRKKEPTEGTAEEAKESKPAEPSEK
jgi:LmeA-like phospholipid-binding